MIPGISASLERHVRDTMIAVYGRITDESEASPGEAFSLLSSVLLDIRDSGAGKDFEQKDRETRLSILTKKVQDIAEELYMCPAGAGETLPCFFGMLSSISGLSFENACLAYEVQSRPNIPGIFSRMKTREEWEKEGTALLPGAVPVHMFFQGGDDTVTVYDVLYTTAPQTGPSPAGGGFEELIDRDFTCFLTLFGIPFRRNDRIASRAKYDPETNCILYRRGRDNTEAYRYVIRSIADAEINRITGEGTRYGLTGFYELAADAVTYIVAARRGVIFNDIRRDRIECFHSCFMAEDRDSFIEYIGLIMKVADKITSELERDSDEHADT